MTKNLQVILQRASCLYNFGQISEALDRMAQKITQDLQEENPLLLCVMVGGLILTGHLSTRLHFPLELDYIHATRYRGTLKGGSLNWIALPRHSLRERSVLVLDDIMDDGLTLLAIINKCREAGAKEVRSAVLITKNRKRASGVDFEPDYTGLATEDQYVFGFGLDYKDYFRNLPDIYALAEQDME